MPLAPNSSGVVTGYRVDAPPQNGVAAISGDGSAADPWVLTYTPAANFLGTETVSVVATGIDQPIHARDISATEARLAMGDPASELIRVAEDRDVDLIAMSTHGHRFLSDLIHGATADRVRHLVKVPVLLLRAQ